MRMLFQPLVDRTIAAVRLRSPRVWCLLPIRAIPHWAAADCGDAQLFDPGDHHGDLSPRFLSGDVGVQPRTVRRPS
jgi:hypothetical protein